MRIAVDAHVFDEKFQGSRTYLEGIYREAIQLKKDWEFYFFAKDVDNLESVFGKWNHVHYVPLTSKNKYNRLLFEFPRLLKKHQIDFAHFQYITPLTSSSKYFVTTHDILLLEPRFKKYFPWKYRMLNGILFKRAARRSNFVLTVSGYSKQKIEEYLGLPSASIYITPNAVTKPSVKIEKDYVKKHYGIEKYILYVSRVEPRKNHLTLLRAFLNLKLHEKGYSLVFVGARDLPYPALDSFIDKHEEELKDAFHQLPGISGEALQHFYALAQAFVYPSLAEGFGIPPLEAAMHGTPVICSNATAMKDFSFFKHHIDPSDQQAMEKSIVEVVNGNHDNPDQIIQAIDQQYSWKKAAEVLVKALEENS